MDLTENSDERCTAERRVDFGGINYRPDEAVLMVFRCYFVDTIHRAQLDTDDCVCFVCKFTTLLTSTFLMKKYGILTCMFAQPKSASMAEVHKTSD